MLLICLIVANLHEPNTPTNDTQVVRSDSPFRQILGGLQAAEIAPGVQVNSLPHPFNLNGSMPYQVWVNGERLPLNGDKADKIVELLDIGPFEQPEDTGDIHQGTGWLTPLPITQTQ